MLASKPSIIDDYASIREHLDLLNNNNKTIGYATDSDFVITKSPLSPYYQWRAVSLRAINWVNGQVAKGLLVDQDGWMRGMSTEDPTIDNTQACRVWKIPTDWVFKKHLEE